MNDIFLLGLVLGITNFVIGFQITKLPQPDSSIIKAGEWLEKAEAAYGEGSPNIIPFLYDLAQKIIKHQNNYEVAFPYLERAFVIAGRQYEPESLEMATALQRTGECALFMGNIKLAEERVSKALAIRSAKLGDDHPMTGQCWAVVTMLELLKTQPSIQPVMLRQILSVTPLVPASMPEAAKRAAEKTLICVDRARKEIYGTASNPETAFCYITTTRVFAICDPLYDEVIKGVDALKNGPLVPGAPAQNCFIATAVYGAQDCPEVLSFRRFRDRKLALNTAGRAFISFYAIIGPIMARLVYKHPILKKFFRMILDSLAKWI